MLQRITPMPPDFVWAAAAPVQPGVLDEKYVWGFQAARAIASPCGKWLVWLTKTRGSHHAGFTKTSNPACELAQDKPVNNLHAGVAVIEAGDRGE